MPHKDAKSAGANGARRQGKRDNWRGEDSTPAPGRNRPVVSTPPERKSGPGRWVRLADLVSEVPA